MFQFFPFAVTLKVASYPAKQVFGFFNKAGSPMVKPAVYGHQSQNEKTAYH
jgi:hypothetical protein